MKYALISDIHSSIDDLQAVFHQIQTIPDTPTIIGMGDLYECKIGKKKVATLTAPLPLTDAKENSTQFESMLTFPSIRGNQEERIMRATGLSLYNHLPLVMPIDGARLIHGHQFKWSADWQPLTTHLPDDTLVFFGHSHDSVLYRKKKPQSFTFGEPILLEKKKYGINVGSVVDNREWVLYDSSARTITFMKA